MRTILLIDDERWVRTALKWTIKNLKLPLEVIHECQNGLEALDWLKQNNVDLIITDVRMPIMDGMTFVKELRTIKGEQDVIVLSVHDEFQFVQQALRSGVTDYLLKPIEEEDLRFSLEKWLKRRKVELEKNKEEDLSVNKMVSSSTIEEVLKFIKKTPLSEVTLQSAAEKVHINPSYLSHLFKQQLNKKFVDYLTELRIEESKRLLQTTTLRLAEIAERVGYSDLAYFSNNFKKITGRSPSEYRKTKALENE